MSAVALPAPPATTPAGTFAALAVPNFRRYLAGQGLSLVGTWMQTIAQGWLVLQLTGSGTVLGTVVAVQLGPILLLGPYGGLLADRFPKRRVLVAAQVLMGLLALALGLLTVTGAVQLWHVFALAAGLGVVRALSLPAQQAFPGELVGPGLLANAVSLNNVAASASRAVGPALAGLLIALLGVGPCFLLNAASFAAVLVSLATMDPAAMGEAPVAERGPGQIRAGLAYVRRTPDLLVPLMIMGVIGTLAYEFPVVLPLLAAGPLGGGAGAYGLMTSAMGVGAVAGGLWRARRTTVGLPAISALSLAFAVALTAAALAPTLALELVALLAVGAASTTFLATASSTLQLTAAPAMRGRVMALWSMAFLGTTPLGGPLLGWIASGSPRAGLLVGAAACLACAGVGAARTAR